MWGITKNVISNLKRIRSHRYLTLPLKPTTSQNVTTNIADRIPPLSQKNILTSIDTDAAVQTEIKTPPLLQDARVVPPEVTIKETKTVSFEDIPGPMTLKTISKVWSIIPQFATKITVKLIQFLITEREPAGKSVMSTTKPPLIKKIFDNYGPIVRLHGASGTDVVLLSRPEDAISALISDGMSPIRSSFDSIELYRLKHRRFRNNGPFINHDTDWKELSKTMESPPQMSFTQQTKKIDSIVDQFIKKIDGTRNKQEEISTNFKVELYKWSLECTSAIAFNEKLGFLDRPSVSPASDAGKLLDGLIGATEAIRKCEYGVHFWQFFETPTFRSVVRNCEFIDGVLHKFSNKVMESLKEKHTYNKKLENPNLIELMLLKGISEEDVMTILLDMFIVGPNVAAHTIMCLLYYLSKNPRCQIKLHEEVIKQSDKLVFDQLNQWSYMKACIKECLRLNPPVPLLNRVLEHDAIINYYKIPKGTHILYATKLNSICEDHYEQAQKFKPERWLNEEVGSVGKEFQNFAALLFGHKPTLREISKTQIVLLIAKMIKKYKIEYHYGDFKTINADFLSSPMQPCRFRFIDRVA